MHSLNGVSVSSGVAFGKAVIIKERKIEFDERKIDKNEVDVELHRYDLAIKTLSKDIDDFIQQYAFSKEDKSILETHKMILIDPEIYKGITSLVKDQLHNLEQAVTIYFNKTINFFKNLDNEFYAERSIDYKDSYERIMNFLLKIDSSLSDKIHEGSIIVTEDIPPSMVSELAKKKASGLILHKGNKTSHSVIIARALNIPVVTGIYYFHKIHEDDMLIIDAEQGLIIVNPDKITLEKYEEMKIKEDLEYELLKTIINCDSITQDNHKISLMANIELPTEINNVLNLNSDGIGLFRTEFFYINRALLPSEEEQFNIYKNIAVKLNSKPLTIRTIDIGGDKMANWYPHFTEDNPYLGCRGIRFSLKYPQVLKTQLKAILRASVFGNIKIMFPMISSVEEFKYAKKITYECMKELDEYFIDYNRDIKIGTMIEIPSAAILSEALAVESDFFSIGTNDLLQYTVAVDRNNESVSNYYNPYNPAFLRLIKMTVDAANQKQIPVSLCGELASDENFLPLLIKFGITEFSLSVHNLLKTKQSLKSINYEKLMNTPLNLNDYFETDKMKNLIHNLKKQATISKEEVDNGD